MTALDALAERVLAGDRIREADAPVLLGTHDLIAVGSIADDLRRRLHGARTTFVRVFEVHVDAPPASLPPGFAAGEIRIVGGPPTLDAAVKVVSRVRALAGSVPVTGFSLADMTRLGAPLDEAASTLQAAGLDAIAGVDLDYGLDLDALQTIRTAGLSAYRLIVGTYGDVPPAAMIGRAVNLQRSAGGFRAFAPLPRVISTATPTTGYDDLKLVALARVMAVDIPSIQVDWPLYGPKLAQVALTMGADDVDGVAACDAGSLGTRRSPLAEITGNIRAAAQEPVERNGRFEPTE